MREFSKTNVVLMEQGSTVVDDYAAQPIAGNLVKHPLFVSRGRTGGVRFITITYLGILSYITMSRPISLFKIYPRDTFLQRL